MNRAEMIAELITDKFSGFKEGDEAMLETCADARLEEFRTAMESRKSEATAHTKLESEHRNVQARLKVAEDRIRAAEAEIDEDEFLARAPRTIKDLVDAHRANEQQEKASIVTQLKDLGQHSEEELDKKPLDELRTLAAYARVTVPDFSGRALPRDPASRRGNPTTNYAPPDPYAAGLKALREKSTH